MTAFTEPHLLSFVDTPRFLLTVPASKLDQLKAAEYVTQGTLLYKVHAIHGPYGPVRFGPKALNATGKAIETEYYLVTLEPAG